MKTPTLVDWRHAICETDLDSTAKLVALVIGCYMNAVGEARPSRATIARSAGLSVRSVELALPRIEGTGFLSVKHSKGRTANRYQADLTANLVRRSTAKDVRGSDRPTANLVRSNGESDAPNGEARSPEVVEVDKEIGNNSADFDLTDEQKERNASEARALLEGLAKKLSAEKAA